MTFATDAAEQQHQDAEHEDGRIANPCIGRQTLAAL